MKSYLTETVLYALREPFNFDKRNAWRFCKENSPEYHPVGGIRSRIMSAIQRMKQSLLPPSTTTEKLLVRVVVGARVGVRVRVRVIVRIRDKLVLRIV